MHNKEKCSLSLLFILRARFFFCRFRGLFAECHDGDVWYGIWFSSQDTLPQSMVSLTIEVSVLINVCLLLQFSRNFKRYRSLVVTTSFTTLGRLDKVKTMSIEVFTEWQSLDRIPNPRMSYAWWRYQDSCLETAKEIEKLFKVPLTPKYFFRENESLSLFERHCGHFFLFLRNPAFL